MDFLNLKPRPPLTPEARERQRTGQYKGLLHAAQKRKADNSANYATNFNHGQMALDFERSAEAAGESREEVRGHFSLLDRTLLTLCGFFPRIGQALPELQDLPQLPLRSDAASPRAPKLVRALALLLWRPLRLYRNQENRERLALCYLLRQIKCWRQQHGELTAEHAEKLHWDLDAILENYYGPMDRRLKRIERRFWKVWRVYRGLVGVLEAVFGSRDSGLGARDAGLVMRDPGPGNADSQTGAETTGSESSNKSSTANHPLQASNSGSSVANHESPITNPETRAPDPETRSANLEFRGPLAVVAYPARSPLVQQRGTPHYDQFHPDWLHRIDDLSPEGIGNPFQSPSHALKEQQKSSEPAAIKDLKEWQEHPPKPRTREMEFSEPGASEFVRMPSERELRRMVRGGELIVPGTFEDFVELVEMALGARVSRPQEAKKAKAGETPALPGYLHALAESLWNRTHAFSPRLADLRELLGATLEWVPNRFLPLWKKLLPVEYAYGAVDFFQRTHSPNCEDIAWGDDETTPPWRECKRRPAEMAHSEADGRKKHAGELQHALRIWLHAVRYALTPVMRSTHKVTVALYDWAVSRFGIREEFLLWRPNLSLAQLDTRRDRPEWAVRVVTVTGKTLVKLSDGQIFEPDK